MTREIRQMGVPFKSEPTARSEESRLSRTRGRAAVLHCTYNVQ